MANDTVFSDEQRQFFSTSVVDSLVQQAILRIAESDCPILILGEPGVGKRTIAARIHALSSRANAAFHEFRCTEASLTDLQDIFSTDGTVYLPEITDIPLSVQESIIATYFCAHQPPTCRLLCGSSREPGEEVKSWRVREDFFSYLSAITLRIPPLRCRRAEILTLAEELLTRYSAQFDRPKPVLCKESIQHLMEHSWPGNLPELKTAIQTFVAIGDQAISLAAIKAVTGSARANGTHKHVLLKEATRASSIQIERQLISEVLASTSGNRKRAATELGISYKALLYKLKQMESERLSASSKNGAAQ